MIGEEPKYFAGAKSVLGGVSPHDAVQAASLRRSSIFFDVDLRGLVRCIAKFDFGKMK